MRCNGCGDENLVLDDTSGRYVCTSCWQVTEYFESLTQEASELVNLRGLRMVHTASSASLIPPSQFSYQEVATKSEPLPEESQLPFKIESPSASPQSYLNGILAADGDLPKPEDLKDENADGEALPIRQPKLSKRKESKRTWRLSEPFTVLLRIQLSELLRTYFKKGEKEGEDRDGGLLRETAWCLWTNYLAITGELGSRPWALAFQQVSAAACQLLRSRQSFLSFSSTTVFNKSQWPRKPIKREMDLDSSSLQQQPLSPNSAILMVNAVWLNMQFRTKKFHWAGWGQIYNPKEAAGLSFLLFGPEPDSPPGLDENSDSSADDEDCNEEEHPAKSKPATPAARRLSLNGGSSLEPPPPVDELLNLSSLNTDPASLQQYWAEMVVDKMSKKSLGEQVFWRGQVDHMGDRLLMECNLALLFLASLLAFATPPPKTAEPDPDGALQPTCRRGFLTLRDLQCICAEKRFPFLAVDTFLEGFPVFDQGLDVLFQRKRVPSAECLARVAVVLIHMLGIYHRPKIPLCYLVHRFLVELGLPFAVHEMANSLISRLDSAVQQATENARQGLHYFLPLKRYVRGEVFAMAVVVVLLRMLFKLDDCYEYCWSTVAEYLAGHPAKQSQLSSLLHKRIPPRGADFLWTRWVMWAEERHCARLQPGTAPRTDDPINQPVSFSDLLALHNAGEFLGASEFEPGFDVGWGETRALNDYFATNEMKSNMSAPLRAVMSKSDEEKHHHHEAAEGGSRASEQCSTCRRMEVASVLRPFCSGNAPCVEDQCDLLLGVRRLAASKSIPPKVLLQPLFDAATAEAAPTPKNVRKDWLYILEKFPLYAPVSTLEFPLRGSPTLPLCQVHSLPTTVRAFHKEYAARVERFLAGSPQPDVGADCGCTSQQLLMSPPLDEAQQQLDRRGKQRKPAPSTTLRWLLDVACSLCSSDLAGLLREVRCVEILLDLLPASAPTARLTQSVLINTLARDRSDLALAAAFDYSLG